VQISVLHFMCMITFSFYLFFSLANSVVLHQTLWYVPWKSNKELLAHGISKVDLNWSTSDASDEHARGSCSVNKSKAGCSWKHAYVACRAGDIRWMMLIHPVQLESSRVYFIYF
jgi:hypothetical protein